MSQKKIAVLGSTGSIGTQTLDIIAEYPHLFRADVLTARRNVALLAEQALHFKPRKVIIADESRFDELSALLDGSGVKVEAGAEAIAEAAADREPDIVVTAMVGFSGMAPTIAALKAGKRVALANKETLVVGGSIIDAMLKGKLPEGENAAPGAHIVPVDSEHSAIFQCLVGEDRKRMRKIILTASGGPFRKFSREQLEKVKAADALKHPNWDMGAKVTIDSASMMNKGLEMMEACWLFGCTPQDIEIAVHPQSIVHSMVEYVDGSVKAQLGMPDMRLPIAYALSYPDRLPTERNPLTLPSYASLTFEAPDMERFPMLRLAFEAMAEGGTAPCILNAANEIANDAFLHDRIGFMDMPRITSKALAEIPATANPSIDTLFETDAEVRRICRQWIEEHKF